MDHKTNKIPQRVIDLRNEWKECDSARDAGLKEPEDIVIYRDISYAHGDSPAEAHYNLLDLYIPKDSENRPDSGWPVLVSIHGGGYFYGDKEIYRFYCMHLARLGFAVVNFNYRLAPEYLFPAPLEDTMAVLDWIYVNHNKYGLDMENVFMTGDSAGAQLLSHVACIMTNREFAGLFDFNVPEGIKLKAISLACGFYAFSGKEELDEFISDYLGDPAMFNDARTDVIGHITADFPPTFIFSSYCDYLFDACEPMAELLRSRGVNTLSRIYGSPDRADIGHVFHLDLRLPEGIRANNDQAAFFKTF